MIEEDRVHGFANGLITPEREGDVRNPTRYMGMWQGFANDARRLDKGDTIIIVLFYAGRDRKDVGVENDVFRREVEFVAQKIISAGTNLHFAVHRIGLAQFVECHDDRCRAIAPYLLSLC